MKKKDYATLKQEYQKWVDKLHFMVAFSREGFTEIMNLKKKHKKVYNVWGGCYCNERNYKKLDKLTKEYEWKLQNYFNNEDKEWIQDAIYYEMSNHEYPYERDDEVILKTLWITNEAFKEKWFLECWNKAERKLLHDYDW